MENKICTKCLSKKPGDAFYLNYINYKNKTKKRCAECKVCAGERNRKWKEKNKVRIKELRLLYWKKYRFKKVLADGKVAAKRLGYKPCDITAKRLNELFIGHCECCGILEFNCKRRLSLDHNHLTGKFRGFLCNDCNQAVGNVKDSAEIALMVASYLKSKKSS